MSRLGKREREAYKLFLEQTVFATRKAQQTPNVAETVKKLEATLLKVSKDYFPTKAPISLNRLMKDFADTPITQDRANEIDLILNKTSFGGVTQVVKAIEHPVISDRVSRFNKHGGIEYLGNASHIGAKSVYLKSNQAERLNYRDKHDIDYLTEKPAVLARKAKAKRFQGVKPNDATAKYPDAFPVLGNGVSEPLEALQGAKPEKPMSGSGKTETPTVQAPKPKQEAIRLSPKVRVTTFLPGPKGKPIPSTLSGPMAVAKASALLSTGGRVVQKPAKKRHKRNLV